MVKLMLKRTGWGELGGEGVDECFSRPSRRSMNKFYKLRLLLRQSRGKEAVFKKLSRWFTVNLASIRGPTCTNRRVLISGYPPFGIQKELPISQSICMIFQHSNYSISFGLSQPQYLCPIRRYRNLGVKERDAHPTTSHQRHKKTALQEQRQIVRERVNLKCKGLLHDRRPRRHIYVLYHHMDT